MSDWNLPPGVSSSHPAIAGYPEEDMEVSCENSDATLIGLYQVTEMLKDLRSEARFSEANGNTSLRPSEFMHDVLEALDNQTTQGGDCEWSGTMVVQIADGYGWWDCPRCGKQNEVELPSGPDPDDLRDMRRDMAEDER